MKIAWSVFWRLFLLSLAFSIVVALSLKKSAFITDTQFLVWKPSILWGTFAALLILAQSVLPNGLVYILWGNKLNQGPIFWRRLSFATAVLFISLGILSIIVAQVISFENWVKFKTAAPLVGLILFSLVVPKQLALAPTEHSKGTRD